MFNKYYHGTTRKMMVAFCTLFDNLTIDVNGKEVQVPIHMVQGDKFLAKLRAHPDMSDAVNPLAMPVMGYELVSMNTDYDRNTNPLNKIQDQRMARNREYMYNRTAVSWNFDLNVAVKRMEHGLMIMEQIIPYFKPHLNLTVKVIPNLATEDNVQVVLNSYSQNVEYQGSSDDMLYITYTLSFTVKGYIYQDVKSRKTIMDNVINIKNMSADELDAPLSTIKVSSDDNGDITIGE